MERLHAEAAAEIHVIQEAKSLQVLQHIHHSLFAFHDFPNASLILVRRHFTAQEGGGLRGLMRQERAALRSMGKLRRQTRLVSPRPSQSCHARAAPRTPRKPRRARVARAATRRPGATRPGRTQFGVGPS